ncbi:MAG: MlrC C-terminal domain-containing protein [Dongiaceae bacterium]
MFTNVGIDPRSCRIVVVKSTQHFHAGFGPLAAEVLYIEVPAPWSATSRAFRSARFSGRNGHSTRCESDTPLVWPLFSRVSQNYRAAKETKVRFTTKPRRARRIHWSSCSSCLRGEFSLRYRFRTNRKSPPSWPARRMLP